jgi:hypothetical protein
MVDGLRRQFSELAAVMGKSLAELEEEQKAKIAAGEYRTIEEDAAQGAWVTRIVAAGDVVSNSHKFAYNWTIGKFMGKKIDYRWSKVPINLGKTLKLLNE